jgi:mono/diheme cytochrome c family protein
MRKLILGSLALMGGVVALAQAPVSYTANQAAQGKTAFTQACASCHGANLDDG